MRDGSRWLQFIRDIYCRSFWHHEGWTPKHICEEMENFGGRDETQRQQPTLFRTRPSGD
jgi:hypothetical protein